jgi:nucleoside-diphosphate-sugar epimerase
LDNAAIARETGFHPKYDLHSAAADYAAWLSRPSRKAAAFFG